MLGSKLTHCVANRTDSHGRDHASLSFGTHPEGTTHRRSVRCPSSSFAISPCVKRPDLTRATRPSGTRAFPFPISSWTPARRLEVGGGQEGHLAASVQRLVPPAQQGWPGAASKPLAPDTPNHNGCLCRSWWEWQGDARFANAVNLLAF